MYTHFGVNLTVNTSDASKKHQINSQTLISTHRRHWQEIEIRESEAIYVVNY